MKVSSRLTVIGNMNLMNTSTVLLSLNGVKSVTNSYINVTGNSEIRSLIAIKIGRGYRPDDGDLIPFLSTNNFTGEENLLIFGVPYRKASYNLDTTQG